MVDIDDNDGQEGWERDQDHIKTEIRTWKTYMYKHIFK